MSWVVELIIGAWTSTAVVIGCCALAEHRERVKALRMTESWLDAPSRAVHRSEESA
jgi:hypothetical protein